MQAFDRLLGENFKRRHFNETAVPNQKTVLPGRAGQIRALRFRPSEQVLGPGQFVLLIILVKHGAGCKIQKSRNAQYFTGSRGFGAGRSVVHSYAESSLEPRGQRVVIVDSEAKDKRVADGDEPIRQLLLRTVPVSAKAKLVGGKNFVPVHPVLGVISHRGEVAVGEPIFVKRVRAKQAARRRITNQRLPTAKRERVDRKKARRGIVEKGNEVGFTTLSSLADGRINIVAIALLPKARGVAEKVFNLETIAGERYASLYERVLEQDLQDVSGLTR